MYLFIALSFECTVYGDETPHLSRADGSSGTGVSADATNRVIFTPYSSLNETETVYHSH